MIDDVLSRARDLADRLDRAADDRDALAYLGEFVAAQQGIANALYADDALRYTPEVEAYLDACAPILSRRRHLLARIVSDIQRPISGALEADEWFIACGRRSAIESLREVFAGSEVEDELARNLDTEVLDARMREIGEVEGPVAPERVPAGIPDSHWWWRYPAG
jgi:hypothetical protein